MTSFTLSPVGALIAKGALDTLDVAAALLRAEVQAGFADDALRDMGIITDAHAVVAREAMQEWDDCFGLHPSYFALRREEVRWRAAGSEGTHPFDERRIAAED